MVMLVCDDVQEYLKNVDKTVGVNVDGTVQKPEI